VREYVQHWNHCLSKKAMFCLSDHVRQQRQKKMLQEKPSQKPSTPEMACLRKGCNLYIVEITGKFW
jgi:hypothetical protein